MVIHVCSLSLIVDVFTLRCLKLTYSSLSCCLVYCTALALPSFKLAWHALFPHPTRSRLSPGSVGFPIQPIVSSQLRNLAFKSPQRRGEHRTEGDAGPAGGGEALIGRASVAVSRPRSCRRPQPVTHSLAPLVANGHTPAEVTATSSNAHGAHSELERGTTSVRASCPRLDS